MKSKYSDLKEDRYKQFYSYANESAVFRSIWLDAMGDEYPIHLSPFSFLTKKDLVRFSSELKNLDEGKSLLDIGCGRGGPGLRLAELHQLSLTGIDIIPQAIKQAKSFKSNFDLSFEACFKVGGFCGIPMETSSVDVAISVDAFWMVHDKVSAIEEIMRVLKPGASLLFTSWDNVEFGSELLFEEFGFEFGYKLETENWKQFQTDIYRAIVLRKEQLLAEMGSAAEILISEAEEAPTMLNTVGRYFYKVVRKDG
jgi:ubiquinone/menaquinone biosynthesis C-methylase UbiE